MSGMTHNLLQTHMDQRWRELEAALSGLEILGTRDLNGPLDQLEQHSIHLCIDAVVTEIRLRQQNRES